MPKDLNRFGDEFRELRKSLGISEPQIIARSGAYANDRTLRKIEEGKQQPSRDKVIRLIAIGIGIRKTSLINRFLDLAGYAPLLDSEIAKDALDVDELPATNVGTVVPAPEVRGQSIDAEEQN